MLWGAIAAFLLALGTAILVGLGVAHAARTPREVEVLAPKTVVATS